MKKRLHTAGDNKVVIYQTKSGALELRGDARKETLWATQAQIANAFDVDVRTVNEHIKNIFKTKELTEQTTIRKFRIVQEEGKRAVERQVNHYDLDMILSVGYRVNSKRATSFRQWATKTLRAHITDGYTINRTRVAKNYSAFMKAVGDVQNLLPAHVTLDPQAVLELIKEFASTWVSLDAYDKETLEVKGVSKKEVTLVAQDLLHAITQLKGTLVTKGEATGLFASERRTGSIEGIVGNVMQSFGGTSVYSTVEEKAAHLLYFMVKNHPFTDGNKRSGAFAFVWFLKKTGVKGVRSITPSALTALTLLVAESDPKKKEQMVALITNLIR
jgi:prophage maintenance system killer protein